jgi:hypothetical protein
MVPPSLVPFAPAIRASAFARRLKAFPGGERHEATSFRAIDLRGAAACTDEVIE